MTRFVLISDTHNTKPPLPLGEVLVHAGDLTGSGSRAETERAMQWLGAQAQKFKHVIFVGGNHDWFLYHLSREVGKDAVREFVAPYGLNIHYLEDESYFLCEGENLPCLRIYGSPVQPVFCNWAWNQDVLQRRATWAKIPSGVDMLITHGPPKNLLDWVGRDRVGCEELREALNRVQPKVHVFGHIHSGHGKAYAFVEGQPTVQCYNAAVVNEAYQLDPKRHPWVLAWDGKTFTEVPGEYVI